MITPYLPEEEYRKVEGQLRLNMNGVFDFLKVDNRLPVRYVYGLGVFVGGAVDEAVKL
jgi:hypothetical protein